MTGTSRALCAFALYAGLVGTILAQAVFGDGFESTGEVAENAAQASRETAAAATDATEDAAAEVEVDVAPR